MSGEDKDLLERCRKCIRALLDICEPGTLYRTDVIEGARQLLAELEASDE